MKRDKFWLGASFYIQITPAGIFRQTLEKFINNSWGKPIYSLSQDPFYPLVPAANDRTKKTLLASKIRRILNPNNTVSVPSTAQDSKRQKLEEKWEKMASQPAVNVKETEPSLIPPLLLGIKTGSKTKPLMPDKKAPGVE